MFPSDLHAKVFSNQQKTRISTNNDVVTGNTAREKNKNIVSKQKNRKTSKEMINTTIEPFSQKNALNNNNNNDNYTPLSKSDISHDDKRIKIINEKEKVQTKDMALSYSNVSNNLNKFQQGVTDEAKAYNNINKMPALLNKNYITADNQMIRINNAGVVNTLNTLNSNNLQQPKTTTNEINISTSTQNPQPYINYIPIKNIPTGATSGSDTGLYSETSSTTINMPSGISGYNLEGENVYVLYPYPNSVAAINQNMSYLGAYTSVYGLNPDNVISPNTTLKCIQHAIDNGYTACGMTNYSGGSGNSLVGNISTTPTNYAYNVLSLYPSSYGLTFPQENYSSLTFGADGVLYAGYGGYGGNNLFSSALTPVFNSSLNPTYGGTINNLVASYAYNQGYWNNLTNFSGNSDLRGQPSGTLNTLYQYNIEIPNIGYYTQTYYNMWGDSTAQIPYVYYTTQTETQYAAPNTGYGNLTYINYYCGNNPAPNTPINVGGQNAGVGYNLTCAELYNQYPSFTLTLSDTGVLTISNSNSNTGSSNTTISMIFNYTKVTLSNGQQVTLNMPRPDWVSGSINDGGNLTSSSMNTPSMNNGQWISSPNGFCRLILTGDTLELQYSLQDVTQDTDGNLIGSDSSSVALYSIQNVNASNLVSSAHIDINGALNSYPSNMIGYDNTYTKMEGYIPNPAFLNPNNSNSFIANDEQCKVACNNSNDPSSTCAGYVVYNGNCNILTADKLFPTGGDRIPNTQYSTYIRNPKFPQNDKSCRDTLDAVIDSDAYSYYLGNGITPNTPNSMTTTTKCNLGKVLDKQTKELKILNSAAVKKGEEVKKHFNKLFNRKNSVLNSISDNRTKAKIYDDFTKGIVDKIQDIENSQITKLAAEKDSELLLVSDNYRYVIWGIVSLLLSIAAIKGLRMASS